MKTLYLECAMGAAGDMLTAALLELHGNPDDFLHRLNRAGIPGVQVKAEPSVKCSIMGTHVTVTINGQEEQITNNKEQRAKNKEHDHHHHHDHKNDPSTPHPTPHTLQHHHSHNSYHDIEHLIGHLNVSDTVKKNVLGVYKLIAEAESRAHGVPVHQVHFHEVGELDALADITGVCMLLEELAPDAIFASPVNTGSGHVRCAHGMIPVPAPATARILQGVPVYNDQITGELCTPTGAALLKYFVNHFCAMPLMTVDSIGYGMGTKDFAKANCVRAFLGRTVGASAVGASAVGASAVGASAVGAANEEIEEIIELVCNVDDMTAEAAAFAQQLLIDEGALDVFITPAVMKKGRSGLNITCLCRVAARDKILPLMFKHTSTLGIREHTCRRYTLHREQTEVQTCFGRVRVKTSGGFGVTRTKPEYEDIAKLARENNISMQDVLKETDPPHSAAVNLR